MNNNKKTTYFAKTDHRGKEQKFGIKDEDRMKHVYVVGKTGMGKSTLLENMAIQDIRNGNGVAFIDPHGATAEALLDFIPKERIQDVLYFAPFDMEHPISFNIMEDVGYDKRHLVVSGLISAFKKIWVDMWSARMEYILTNTLFALLEYPNSTLLDVNRMLIDKDFRKDVISHITDTVVKSFWADEFAKYTDRYTQEATPAIQNKVGQFVSNPIIRNIIGQPKSSFDFRELMDAKKILIMNLSKGRMGDVNSQLIGSMLIVKIYLAAMSRADTSPQELQKLPPFYFYVDEFQAFANETFADILSEARKYKMSLTIAHQYIEQMPEEVRDAVFGNVGTMMIFRVGAYDAEVLEKEFAPTFTAEDIVNLGFARIYLKLMIDGLASRPFSAMTLSPIAEPEQIFRDEVIEHSRKTYTHPRSEVEEAIRKRYEPITPVKKEERVERREEKRGGFEKQWRREEGHVRRAPDFNRRSPQGPPQREARRDEREDRRPSFKKAFEGERERRFGRGEREASGASKDRETVSLKLLQSNQRRNVERTSENLTELRKVLAGALKEKEEAKSSSERGDESKSKEEHSAGASQRNPQPIPEVPEDELRKMLKIDTDSESK